jgi:hypothetical protein
MWLIPVFVLLIIGWIATSDGREHKAEQDLLKLKVDAHKMANKHKLRVLK